MSDRQRVVVTARLYAPEPAAASFRLRALVDALADAGASVEVLTSSWLTSDRRERPRPGVVVRRARVLRDAAGYVRGYLQYMSFDIPLAVRLLLARRPDVVVCEPPPTTGIVVRTVCALRRLPYVYYAADLWSEATDDRVAPRSVQRLLSIVENWALRGARTVLSVSPELTQRLTARGVDRGVVTVGNGVDTSVFTPEGDAVPSSGPLILYTGTASEVHGATIFVEAMGTVVAEVPGVRLVFMGQGAEMDQVQALAASLPTGTVELLPRQEPAEVARWLRAADVALASVRPGAYEFSFPSKVYAAAACGTPVLFAGAGPAERLVTENALGSAVEYDVDAVARAMIDLLRAPAPGPAVRRARATWAREHASLFEVGRRAARAVLTSGAGGTVPA